MHTQGMDKTETGEEAREARRVGRSRMSKKERGGE